MDGTTGPTRERATVETWDSLLRGTQMHAMPRYATAWMQEAAAFLARRLEADAGALRALGSCTSLTEMLEVQQRWAQAVTQDYSNAGVRAAGMAASLGAELAAEQPAATRTAGTDPAGAERAGTSRRTTAGA